MKIPTILSKKEALPFLEWFKNGFVEQGYATFMAQAKPINAFLTSDFKPEMIPELFEGCKWVRNSNRYFQLFIYGKKEFTFPITNKAPYRFKTAHYTKVVTRRYMYKLLWPQTLNDFISDCKRAGITLTYK